MITAWDIYLIGTVDNIVALVLLCGICLVIPCLAIYLAMAETRHSFCPQTGVVIGLGIGLVLLIFAALIPSSKTLAAMYLVPKIANNEQIAQLPENAAKLMNAKMQEWIADSLDNQKKKEK